MTVLEKQQDLEKLQEVIYLEKVRGARKMTPSERLAECFELSDEILMQMLAGAMWQLETEDIEEGWLEVRRRLDRLEKAHEQGFYSLKPKGGAMKILELARLAIDSWEAEGIDYMLTGSFATSCYGIPRATRDVDFVVSIRDGSTVDGLVKRMKGEVELSLLVSNFEFRYSSKTNEIFG